ncbi:MAG: hypothetical protein WCE62_10000 [Polyangiales bacterium]
MRIVLLASALTAGVIWLALGGAPVQSQTEAKPATCETCGQAGSCPYCAKGADCPHGKTCPHCKGNPRYGAHKWEYKCVHQSERADKKAAEAMTEQFNGLGAEGWRLAKADNGFWCFMRMHQTK